MSFFRTAQKQGLPNGALQDSKACPKGSFHGINIEFQMEFEKYRLILWTSIIKVLILNDFLRRLVHLLTISG